MTRLSTAEVEAALDRAERGERVILQRDGKDVAAIVPAEDLDLLERLIEEEEDREDVEAADEALAEMERTGEKPIPYDVVRRELGLP